MISDLKCIGFSDWFKSRADDEKITAHGVARVVSVHKDSYIVTKGGEGVFAELSGNLLYSSDSASDLPTTGDWVYVMVKFFWRVSKPHSIIFFFSELEQCNQ